MCGLAGFLFSHALPTAALSNSSARVQAMADSLAHRGPDDSGIWASEDRRCILASRRLAIQDLSAEGRMPMTNENGDIWVAFNGEIYNFKQLRRELEELGHVFRSDCDTETLVHGYETWGPNFLEHLDGMFAIALYDEQKGRLLLARDRCGEKPLYYGDTDEGFVFASEMKAVLEGWGNKSRHLDPEALSQYLTYGFVMPPLSLVSGIGKLAPGEALLIERSGHRRWWNYWTPAADRDQVATIRARPPAQQAADVLRLLTDSVQSRLVADVPVGAFLSGGVDSSAVVALMSRLSGRRIEAVTVAHSAFPELDESTHAEQFAREIGAACHRVEITEEDAIGSLSDMVWHFDEPTADPAALNTWTASRYLRQNGIIVALVGEGADELFLGYGNYLRFQRLANLWPLRNRLPASLLRGGEIIGQAALAAFGGGVHRDLLRRARTGEPMFLGTEVFFQDIDKPGILGTAARGLDRRFPAAEVAARVQAAAPEALRGDPLSLISYSEVRMRMAEKLLMRVDKMSMAHSIEVRAPFLDHYLADYALSLPGAARTVGGVSKALLKEAVAGLVPQEIINRRKQGFSTPVAHWLKGAMGDYLQDRLVGSGLFRDGVLDARGVGKILDAYRSGDRRVKGIHTRLWNILMLAEWYDRYQIDGIAITNGLAERRDLGERPGWAA